MENEIDVSEGKCAYCGGRLGLDWIEHKQEGLIHYSRISCAEILKQQRDLLARQVEELRVSGSRRDPK